MKPDDKILVTVKEAAEMLSIGVSEAYGLAGGGHLEKRYIGSGKREYRITVDSVRAYAKGLPQDAVQESA